MSGSTTSSACAINVARSQQMGFHHVDSLSSKREQSFAERLTSPITMACDVTRPSTTSHCQANPNQQAYALALKEQFNERMSSKCTTAR